MCAGQRSTRCSRRMRKPQLDGGAARLLLCLSAVVGARHRRRHRGGRGAGFLRSHHRLLRQQVPDRKPADHRRERTVHASGDPHHLEPGGSAGHARRRRRDRARRSVGVRLGHGASRVLRVRTARRELRDRPGRPDRPAHPANKGHPVRRDLRAQRDPRVPPAPRDLPAPRRLLRRPRRDDLPRRRAPAGRPGHLLRRRRHGHADVRRDGAAAAHGHRDRPGTWLRHQHAGGINCGTDCTESYARGTSVELRATSAPPNSYFLGWSGACTGPACAP